jgi:hypothetical protein
MSDEAQPERVSLTNMSTLEELLLPYRPEELKRTVEVAYARLAPLGFSHEVMQFQFRKNEKLSFQFGVDQESGVRMSDDAVAILDTMTASSRAAQSVATGAPPEVQVLWPGVLLMRTRIVTLNYVFKRFAPVTGKPTWFTVDVTVEEAPQKRITAEDIRSKGSFRI